MNKNSNDVTDADDEQLVAYLDGELVPEERSELEQRLGRDQSLRDRLRSLQTSWDLLDDLPMAAPNPLLLESTIRMAIATASDTPVDATGPWRGSGTAFGSRPASADAVAGGPMASGKTGSVSPARQWWRQPLVKLALITLACFALGTAISYGWQAVRFRQQLKQLPVAMHLDAYLNASDLLLMRTLINLSEWQKTVEIAERFGEWDFGLQQQIDAAPIAERAAVLQQLPIEHQQLVLQAWQQFERLDAVRKREVQAVAQRVNQQSDAAEVLATMDRFARWQESLPASERDRISSGTPEARVEALQTALQRTVRQWTQQTARLLTNDDTETIYHVLRQIARQRIESLAAVENIGMLQAFGSQNQAMDPRMEAFFLQRLFENPRPAGLGGGPMGSGGPVGSGGPNGPPPNGPPPGEPPRLGPPPARFDFMATAFGNLRPVVEQLHGPLDDDELWMIKQELGGDLQAFLDAAATIDSLQADLLKSWADESLRRIASNRSGSTYSERYQRLDPRRRDLMDLLPPEQILESLRDDWRRR